MTAVIPASLVAIEGVARITVSTPGAAASNPVNFPVIAVSPKISSISPDSAIAGGPAFTMTVTGDGFIPASQVIGLAGATTTYVSLSQLTVSVPASAIANVGTFVIQVVNPGQVRSPQAPAFTVKAPSPAITSLNPPSVQAGGPDFTLTVNGNNFLSGAAVQWNGAPLVTTFVSASQLTALVPAALIATAGTASVRVGGDGGPSNALAFTFAPLAPATSSAGIVNAASSLPAIAPGTLIAIYGSNLAPATAQAIATPLPVSLGGTSVAINGTAAPLLFVSSRQVNAQVPYETKVGTAKLVVQSNGVPSPAVNFEVAATGPGVFMVEQSNHVLALNLADGTLNASQTPARPGQYVTAYLTGQGLVDNAVATGDVAASSPLSRPLAVVQVKIGGRLADIQFAGLAPGFVGLLQMNVLIPDVPAGEQAFEVGIGGTAAAPTVISIASRL
ncbi:MAG: IPT/TIG domain-containing protein [Candidatus Solibacter sp.]|nr:IPT/TIG domain-containing protein [Candidatus Solibacter sp.]